MSSIAQNIADLQKRIGSLSASLNRPPPALLAVSKYHPASNVLEALNAGQKLFGENRVQEAVRKFSALRTAHPDLKLHLIGPLQSNKAVSACETFDVVQTLDRPSLCQALERAADRTGRLPKLYLQVNIGSEPQKAGIPPKEADDFIESALARFPGHILGLMCIPPAGLNPAPFFRSLRILRDRHGLKSLSMGMSGDFETAIREGSDMVRIGTGIFGPRPAPPPA